MPGKASRLAKRSDINLATTVDNRRDYLVKVATQQLKNTLAGQAIGELRETAHVAEHKHRLQRLDIARIRPERMCFSASAPM
jgi:hypothetical protein